MIEALRKKQEEKAPQKKQVEAKKIKEEQSSEYQKRFFINYEDDRENHQLVAKLLKKANEKSHGRPITFKDLVDFALKKLTPKDLERIQQDALEDMDKVNLLLEKYNQKHQTNLKLGEFLVKQLKI